MTNNQHPLLGHHRASQEWYTPLDIKHKVVQVFGNKVYDPCPARTNESTSDKPLIEAEYVKCFYSTDSEDGLKDDWLQHQFIYCNPPTPAKVWALKALEVVKQSKDTVIIFAAFSNDLFNQLNQLEDFPHVKTKKRIKWIDGRELIEAKEDKDGWMRQPGATQIDNKWYIPNPGYLKESTRPSRYNGFVLLSRFGRHQPTVDRFCEQFRDLGTVQLTRTVYKP